MAQKSAEVAQKPAEVAQKNRRQYLVQILCMHDAFSQESLRLIFSLAKAMASLHTRWCRNGREGSPTPLNLNPM